MADDLVLEILNFNWERLYITPNVVSASKTDELGLVGEGSVTIPIDNPAIFYIPDPNPDESYPNAPVSHEGRWKLYVGNELQFAGVVDETARNIHGEDTFTFSGKQRGILLGTKNVGRRDFNGWPLADLFQEFLRDNIGRAPFSTVISGSSISPNASLDPINAITGNPQPGAIVNDTYTNVWQAAASGVNFLVIDVGSQKNISGVRVIPPSWWDQKWYTFTVHTSTDNSVFDLQGTQSLQIPLSDRGVLYEFTETARYVKVTVTGSSDNIARLSQILIYEDQAQIGGDTDFIIPWIENDDSGNVITTGTVTRIVEGGAFNGDGINGSSFVSRMGAGATITHNFFGTADAVFFTQGVESGEVTFTVDGGTPSAPVTIDADVSQFKGFEILNLTLGPHTLEVTQVSGSPKVDYFSGLLASAYRPIDDDDKSIGYSGSWIEVEAEQYKRQFAHRSNVAGSLMYYEFLGDSITIIGQLGNAMGKMDVYIDDVFDATIDMYQGANQWQVPVYAWSGSYANHTILVRVTGAKNPSSAGTYVIIDGLMGNFSHIIYMESSFDNNIRMLTELSEIVNSWLRYNNDGTVDLLGSIGQYSNTIIREGENDGGTIITANTTNDYSESCSAIVAIVSNSDGLGPTLVSQMDNNAVAQMGVKVRVAQHANSPDRFILARQAWSELQEFKKPIRRFTVTYDDADVGPIQVGETTILYSPRLNLPGNEMIRVGKLTTKWDTSG